MSASNTIVGGKHVRAGFLPPLAVTTLALPWRPAVDGTPQEPSWIQRALTHHRWIVQVACLIVLSFATAALSAEAYRWIGG